jgi:hypothetical protein
MGKIHHAHQTEHQRQAERGQRVKRPDDQAIGKKLKEQIHIALTVPGA